MKKFLLITIMLLSGLGYSQTGDRSLIIGKISVPPGDDPDGITIINTTTNRGAVADENGEFNMEVAVGDVLSLSAIQFEEFTVVIHQNVVEAGELNIFISEAATELPEVVVSPIDLSGNVEVDVRRIPESTANIPHITQEEVFDASLNFKPDSMTTPENIAMRDSFMENGLNFANVFRALLSSRETGEEEFQPIDEEVRELYDDEFFREYMNIDRTQISNFILYAEDNGLTEEMLEEGNELELIDFLIEQSTNFKREVAVD